LSPARCTWVAWVAAHKHLFVGSRRSHPAREWIESLAKVGAEGILGNAIRSATNAINLLTSPEAASRPRSCELGLNDNLGLEDT